jgi:transposase
MRATRDLLRRRTHLLRRRAELFSPGHQTTSPYNLPEIGTKMAHKANRDGVAERFAAAAGHKPLAVDLALITAADERRKDLELALLKTAKHHEAHTLDLRHTVPGMGPMLSLVLLDDIHRIARFPSVPAFASDARLVQGRQESGGTRWGTAGKKIGNAHLQWAFAEAATLCWRTNPQGQTLVARLEKQPGTGTARSLLAHKLGRAVYCRLKRKVAFTREMCLRTYGSSAGEPGASLDASGMSLERVCAPPSPAASWHAKARLGP